MTRPHVPRLPPDDLVTQIWQQLTRASHDKHHTWRTPALATVDVSGQPQVRTLVLRSVSAEHWQLMAYTDVRSAKCQQVRHDSRAALLFWSPRLHWQLRVQVETQLHVDGPVVDAAWQKIALSASAKDFLSEASPGSVLASSAMGGTPSTAHAQPHALAVLQFQVHAMDWLALDRAGHCRAHIDATGHVTPLWP